MLFCSACTSNLAVGNLPNQTETIQPARIAISPTDLSVKPAPSTATKLPSITPSVTHNIEQPSPTSPDSTSLDFSEDQTYPFSPLLSLPIPAGYNRSSDPTYRYGSTQNGARIPHVGVEFYNDFGTPVIAAGDGIVLYAGTDKEQRWGQFTDFYGNLVIIEHTIVGTTNKFYSLYAHLSKIDVKSRDVVQMGEKIGEVGKSGAAFGSHLHFEVRLDQPTLSQTRNPELFLQLNPSSENPQPAILCGRVIDARGNFVEEADITIQKIIDEKISNDHSMFLQSYAKNIPNDPNLQENFLVPNIPAGSYRISVYIQGVFVEKRIEVAANQLIFIVLQPGN